MSDVISLACKNCNTESGFDIKDGVYICKECEYELQGTREEVGEEEFGVSRRRLVRSPALKSPSQEKTSHYSAWTATEAFNIIISKQVSALINLGASNKLKDVVLYIWSRYLQKCKVAFQPNKESDEQLPRINDYAWKRDLKVLYGAKYVKSKKNLAKSKPIKKKQTKVSKKKSKANKVEVPGTSVLDADDDDDAMDSSVAEKLTLSDENSIRDEENEMCVDNELCDETNSIDDDVYSSQAQKKKSTRGKTAKTMGGKMVYGSVECMTTSKTLCFCYLGILYTGDQLLLSDLIRFVHEGRIPYLNVTRYFPPSMKLSTIQSKLFAKVASPDLWQISQTCAKLIDFLDLPKFKHRPLMPIVFRFTRDLNLPDNVVQILKILLDKNKKLEQDWYETKKTSHSNCLPIPIYEVQALASIVIVLKMILVLDGKYELEHSEVMEKINILLKDRKLFVWNNWKKQASLIEYLFMKPELPFSNFSLFDSLSADEIASKYPFISSKETEEFPRKYPRALLTAARHEIANIFWGLRPEEDRVLVKTEPTSFPLKQQINYLMTKWDALPMYKETQEIDFTFLSEDMTSHQLFLKPVSCDASSDDLISLLLASLYECDELIHQRQRSSYCQNILRSTSKYWYKNFPGKGVRNSESAWIPTLPSSFQWLLKLLCKYIHINCKHLYTEVLRMEKELFLHRKNFS